jgi:hypothetical protein
LTIVTINANKRRAHYDIGWASTTTPFRDSHCSNSQHPLHARQRPTSAFIGFGFATPEPMLSSPRGHHLIRNEQQS